ncbi:hypothetical protein KQX54_005894 [Cotesia glomerata]|uniref:Uncharacterized protein n=1 Tax=Cotesia glomerata TaxID=32391 RepID=A0AAV7IQF0_COTGL|nr:hypothetical protein KQX54_005894 [Cotesia glomerata]
MFRSHTDFRTENSTENGNSRSSDVIVDSCRLLPEERTNGWLKFKNEEPVSGDRLVLIIHKVNQKSCCCRSYLNYRALWRSWKEKGRRLTRQFDF